MNRLAGVLQAATRLLQAKGRGFALVGGLAVSTRAEPRFTRDVDLAVSVTGDSDAEQLVRDLLDAGYATVAVVEQEEARRLATVRLRAPGEGVEGVVVDLLLASSGIEPEVVRSAEPVEILPGLSVPVASVGHLLALKILAQAPSRPQDAVDIRSLIGVANPADLAAAREAVALIERRGFQRRKDLRQELEAAIGAPPGAP